jgi:hypothetical protein
MLLDIERERLQAVLQSRTASHEERKRARTALEADGASAGSSSKEQAGAPPATSSYVDERCADDVEAHIAAVHAG